VSTSRTIRVVKNDGSTEEFDLAKLAGSIWAAMRGGGSYCDALELAKAVRAFLERIGWTAVSSAAIFEMTLKVLRKVRFNETARAYETSRQIRKVRRKKFRVVHENGQVTLWDKSWLAKFACQSWHLSWRCGRILAATIERQILNGKLRWISREDLIASLNSLVADYGLADAVPVGGEARQSQT